jgi:hypothetical protein
LIISTKKFFSPYRVILEIGVFVLENSLRRYFNSPYELLPRPEYTGGEKGHFFPEILKDI